MKRLRFFITLIILWLFWVYNIERLSQPINISSVAYIFTALIAALTVFVPRLNQVPLWLIVGGPIPVFLALKMWLASSVGRGDPVSGHGNIVHYTHQPAGPPGQLCAG